MAYETVLYDVADRLCTITLNRPEKLNAWTRQMHLDLKDAMQKAGADRRRPGHYSDRRRPRLLCGRRHGRPAGDRRRRQRGSIAAQGRKQICRAAAPWPNSA